MLEEKTYNKILQCISSEPGKAKQELRKEIDVTFKQEIERQFNLSGYLGLRDELIKGKKINGKKAQKLAVEIGKKIKGLMDVIYFWEKQLNEMPRETPDYEAKYLRLRELKHIYSNIIVSRKMKLEMTIGYLKKYF